MTDPVPSPPPKSSLPALDVPQRWRTPVYVVGMLGFPVVIAFYLLVVLSVDLKRVNETLTELSTRIDERPMGIEKSTDFIVYLTDSLRTDLQSGFSEFSESLELSTTSDMASVAKVTTIVKRELDGYVRPIVRRHQRFSRAVPHGRRDPRIALRALLCGGGRGSWPN